MKFLGIALQDSYQKDLRIIDRTVCLPGSPDEITSYFSLSIYNYPLYRPEGQSHISQLLQTS